MIEPVLRLVVLVAFAAALAASLLAAPAWACSCPPVSADEAFASHPAVFLGVVRAADGPYPLPDGGGYVESGRNFRFDVLEAWKGVDRRSVVVHTGSGGGDCGVDFILG